MEQNKLQGEVNGYRSENIKSKIAVQMAVNRHTYKIVSTTSTTAASACTIEGHI